MEAKQQQAPQQAEDGPETEDQDAQQSEQLGSGPIGSGDYVVRDGDCVSSIAKNSGHFWETVWDDPDNAELRSLRKDPNVLLPGDQLTVPPLRKKDEPGEAEMRHRFVRRGEPAMLRLHLIEGPLVIDPDDEASEVKPDKGHGHAQYRLVVDGQQYDGVADAEGWIECPIPGNARKGVLTLNPGTDEEEEFEVVLGYVAPITEWAGVRQRLTNLGFRCGSETADELTPELEAAIRAFQKQNKLPDTGKPDEATRTKLEEVHGS